MQILAAFIRPGNEMEILLVKGFAGTGKTTLGRSLVRTLDGFGQKYMLLAPTGRAAKVLSAYTGKPAYTIHKKIYRQNTARDGVGMFTLDRNLTPGTLFVVDEASMIANQEQEMKVFGSGRLLDDLVEYVYSKEGCKLILLGDTAQLPPVGLDISPALDPAVLGSYNLTVRQGFLKEVLRQASGSGILINATRLREGLEKNPGEWPRFLEEGFEDIRRIHGNDLSEELSDAYGRSGMAGTIVVTRSNRRANQYNAGIRNRILWREEDIMAGDLLMVVRNNYYWTRDEENMDFIANGDIAEILDIRGRQERYGFRFADVTLRFTDYGSREMDVKIMLDTLTLETPSLGFEENRKLYFSILEDYPEIRTKKKKFETAREHPFYNALQVKFAYAVTCHKAQGGQWDTVFIDQGFVREDLINREYYRWLYTAVTRASRKLYLVNFQDRYFEGD